MLSPYEKAMQIIQYEHEITTIIYNYIDRMNDPCEHDPIENIVGKFLADINPIISQHLKSLYTKTTE
jgi:hypothetical protein